MYAPRVLAGGVSLCIVLTAGSVRADERFRAEAERRNRQASALYSQGRFDSALQMYQSAYDLVPDPRFLFNIGLAREKTFDYEGCALAFAEFLRKADAGTAATVRTQAEERQRACLTRTEIPVPFTSVPTNAAVHLVGATGKELRGRTPATLRLPPGSHRVVVEMAGYVAEERTIEVAVGGRPQADFVLEKLSSLRVEVDPAGARVRLGDGPWEPTPATRQVRAGVHEVLVEKQGYEPARRQVKVEPGQEVSLVLSLRALPAIRRLAVSAAGARAARVAIDGGPASPVPAEVTLSPGSHRIAVTAPGRIPYAGNLALPADRDVRLLVELAPERSRRNRVTFWSLTGGASAAAIVGITYGVLAVIDQRRFNDDGTDVALHERGERRARNADIWLGTAVVLGGGAVLYRYLTRPPASTARWSGSTTRESPRPRASRR